MTEDKTKVLDPAQCPFRDTCPHLMLCVTEFIAEMARKDWGLDDETTENEGERNADGYTD